MPTRVEPEAGASRADGERLLPLFVKLAGRRVVLVGGGPVAASKLKSLLETGAAVTVIAPEIVAEIESAAVNLLRREFSHGDLEGAWLAVAAATPEVNRRVAEEAEQRRVLVNAVDDPASASAYTGGVFRRGGVTVAVSTEGRAPALAGLLREGLEALVPEDVDSWIAEAQALRKEWKRCGVPMPGRRPLLLEALNRLYADRREAAAPAAVDRAARVADGGPS
jgi:uroporphyrin-III C-methyltransferase/precorrin-2 dehydrogenase/sirohydrochlorin ferrochelatase